MLSPPFLLSSDFEYELSPSGSEACEVFAIPMNILLSVLIRAGIEVKGDWESGIDSVHSPGRHTAYFASFDKDPILGEECDAIESSFYDCVIHWSLLYINMCVLWRCRESNPGLANLALAGFFTPVRNRHQSSPYKGTPANLSYSLL